MNPSLNLMCRVCRSRVQHLRQWESVANANRQDHNLAAYQCVTCFHMKIVLAPATDTFPRDDAVVWPREDTVRDGVPPEVAGALDEALIAVNGGAWNLAITGLRTVLQISVREKGAQGGNLRAEVDSLATAHVIPASLQEWAHELRGAGNDTAHPTGALPFGEQDARDLLALTMSVLDYLYVVPARVESRRKRLEQPRLEP